MFILGKILIGIGTVLHYFLMTYMWVVIIGALITWVRPDPYNPIVRFLRGVTEPLFYWLRRRIPLVIGGIDISPVIVILAIQFTDIVLPSSLIHYGNILLLQQ
jgi:YggT family protein